jgi:outer membrane protein TolC
VLNADMNTLQADQAVANLLMDRRDQQIALASALGGGYVDTSSEASETTRAADSAAPSNPAVASR